MGTAFCVGHAYSQIVINEILASNATGLADEEGDTEDWIELYNAGDEPVPLSGIGLSDDPDDPYRWTFPDGVIEPGQFLVIWASGKDRADSAAPLHANFAIARSGEPILLTGADGVNIDHIPPTPLPTDVSLGRFPDGSDTWRFFTSPSPGSTNSGPHYGQVLADPDLSHPPGFYAAPFDLSADHPHPLATLHYTTDGSIPTAEDPLFPSELPIASRANDSNLYSSINTTYLGRNTWDHMWQEPDGRVDKCTVLRIRAFAEDAIPSRPLTASYFVDPEQYESYTLPVISLVVASNDFFSAETGIYVGGNASHPNHTNFRRRGPDWERPVHIEFFEKNRELGFRQDAGVRIHGGASRNFSLKSLRLYARNQYGESAFHYRLFPDLPDDRFQRFILRNSGQDIMRTHFRDGLLQSLVSHMQIDTQAFRPVIVFINGEYWGLHNIRERYDPHYLARTYGVDRDHVDILEGKHDARSDRVVKHGDATHYAAMRNYVETHGVVEPENYAYIQTQIDTDNYVDYLVANIYFNNNDWPGNNIEYWRLRTEEYLPDAAYGHDGRWRWLLFDTDHGYSMYDGLARDRVTHNTLEFATTASGSAFWPNPPWSTFLARNMLLNESFRNQFVNRMCDQLNTAFQPHRVHERIDEMRAAIEPEMPRHIARHHRPGPQVEWEAAIDVMRTFASQRPLHQRNHLVHYFNLPGLATVTVDVNSPSGGTIQVNSIHIDETTLGLFDPSTPYPWSGIYARGIPVEFKAHPAPGYRFAGWDAFTNTQAHLVVELTNDFSVVALFEELSPGASIWTDPDGGQWIDPDNWTTTNAPTGADMAAIILPLSDANLDIDLGVDLEIGSIHAQIPDPSNRLRIQDANHSLTFASTNGRAELVIDGDGDGYVELNVEGGTWLESDLHIHTATEDAGNEDYGAIRLRRSWDGPGSLIKSGPGILTMTGGQKHYSGSTHIEAGILRLTEPASPILSTQIVVHAGGQLQWVSGNTPRTYLFGGPLRLSGMGPDPVSPSGALQYHPGTAGPHAATLATPLVIDADAGIDIPGADNRLRIASSLHGTGTLIKRGAGTLEIAGAGHPFASDIVVEQGHLQISTWLNSSVELAEPAWLSGSGRIQEVSGMGSIQLDDTLLTAASVTVPTFHFLIRQTGSPHYENEASSGNAVLRLIGEPPFVAPLDSNTLVHVYLNLDRTADDIYRGTFFLQQADDFTELVAAADWRFYEQEEAGETVFAGQTFRRIEESFIIDTVPATAEFEGDLVSGRILRFRPATRSLPYDQWLHNNFSPAEQADPSISGPTAIDVEGWPNLLRYAVGANRDQDLRSHLPMLHRIATPAGPLLIYRYRRRTETEKGIAYTVEATDTFVEWQPLDQIRPDIAPYSVAPTGDGVTENVDLHVPTQPETPLFLRLRIRKED